MPIEVLDPTWGDNVTDLAYADRLDTLAGATIGIVSNGKQGTRAFFDALAAELIASHGAADVEIAVKSNYSAPAEAAVMDRATRWNALVSGIGDWGSCSSCSLHDAVTGERLGLPSVAVMTENFVSAAELMGQVLGADGYPFVVIEHPISSASRDTLGVRAQAIASEVVRHLAKGA